MVWVKGELLSEITAPGVDPTRKLTREAQGRLFDRREWFEMILKHMPVMTPIIARASSEGSLVWLCLARTGGKVTSLSNWYTMAFKPVYSGEADDVRHRQMLTAIARRLSEARPRVSSITLSTVPREDGTAALLMRAFRKGGWIVRSEQSSTSWTADVAGLTFEEYWAARPGQLRSTYKRRLPKAAFETQIFDYFDENAWEDYVSVYSESWKPSEGSPAFLRDLAEQEGASGCLRIGICRIDGRAVAAQFWTVENGRALIHKLAHRESAKEFSPGTILSAAMFRHVIDVDDVHTIDFGTGNDPYKAEWMDSSAPLDTVHAYNPRSIEGVVGAAKSGLSELVRRARTALQGRSTKFIQD